MITRYLKITLLVFILMILKMPVSAQDTETAADSGEPFQPSTFTIEESRYGGAMAEDGTWELTAGLTIEDTTSSTQEINVQGSFNMHSPGLCYHASEKIMKGIFILLVGERIFDANGDYRYGQHILSSSYLTDTGLPVEGILKNFPTDTFGGKSRHPINQLILVPTDDLVLDKNGGFVRGDFQIDYNINQDTVPAGYYKFTLLVGIQLDDTHFITLRNIDPNNEDIDINNGSFASMGIAPVGKPSVPHLPWVLLPDDIECGGVISRHEKDNFALTNRSGFSPIAVLPPVSPDGGQIAYRLEPSLPFLQKLSKSPLSLDVSKGEFSVSIKTPDGHMIDLGDTPIKEWEGPYLTAGNERFFFAFSAYGHHEIEITGYVMDKNGVKIHGGGIYDIYIAKPLELRPVLKPGMPLKPKENLDLSLSVIPPVPAKISVKKTLNPYSIKGKIEDDSFNIFCNRWGIYTPPATYKKKRWTKTEDIRFSREGEYRIDLIAEYHDSRGVLYMGAKTLAGVVVAENSIELRGEDPAFRSTYPQGDKVFTIPPRNDELIAFPIDTCMIFDPDMKVVLTDSLRDNRVLMGERTYELADGEIGVLPRSTADANPAHFYPEKIDRKMYSYVAASAPDGRTMFVVKDGGPMTDELEKIRLLMDADMGDFYQVYGSMVFRDYPLDKFYYSAISTGAFPKEGILNPTSVPFSGGRVSMYERRTPFMHSFSFYPGALITKDKAFVPRFYVFPPTPGLVKITLALPNGEQSFFTCKVDERGFSTEMIDPPIELWQEGVYEVKHSFYPNQTDPKTLEEMGPGVGSVQFPFYVIKNSGSNRFEWNIKSGHKIARNKPLTLASVFPEDAYTEGTANYTLEFNGELIVQDSVKFKGNGFEIAINIPKIIEDIPNLDMRDPMDVIEISCFVKGVNAKGKNRFMASRMTIRSERLEY